MNLVTGGAGFVGSHLVQQLLDEDQCVRVLEHPDAAVDHLPLDRIELIRADIRDETAVMESTRECRYVYHLAADPNLWRRDRREFEAVNNIGTVNVMRAALDNGAERVLHTTTESILTTWDSNGGAVEDLRLKESDMLGPYCLSKFHAEEAVFQM
ncbi:MAG: NAD-dependent epimerase/dehydratase family protein, partial [Gammaproteobacteria bacterium]|nr:NAD-dependent epimerase/dehydratase family protein [Gammaproteobacteria bacterium]